MLSIECEFCINIKNRLTYKILLNNISIKLVCGEKITWQALSLQIQHLQS